MVCKWHTRHKRIVCAYVRVYRLRISGADLSDAHAFFSAGKRVHSSRCGDLRAAMHTLALLMDTHTRRAPGPSLSITPGESRPNARRDSGDSENPENPLATDNPLPTQAVGPGQTVGHLLLHSVISHTFPARELPHAFRVAKLADTSKVRLTHEASTH